MIDWATFAGASLLFARINELWFALPLIVVVSLVYSATRHELPGPIAEGAVRMAAWIGGFMLIGFAVLYVTCALL